MTLLPTLLGIVLLLSLLVVRYVLFPIESKHYAIFILFGKRWRKGREGLNFKIPFIEKVQFPLYSKELDRLEIVGVEMLCRDKMMVKITGSLEFVPDYEILFKYDETKAKHAKAIEDSIKDEIGSLAGTKDAESFILEREAIQTIINCRIRLSTMPHRQDTYPEVKKNNGTIQPSRRIEFYKKNLKKIQDELRAEKNDPRRSHIEESYGIDAKVFNLTGVDYSADTKKAFEAKKQAEAMREAADSELKLAKAFDGLKPEAVNAAQASLKKAEKKVFSVEGMKDMINISIGGDK